MSYTTIEEYNNYLVENQVNINIIDYVKEVNKLKFNIDISFIDEFIELVSKNECCIHHNMLQKYGIISLNKGTTDIKRLLEQNNFIENEDYLIRNVADQLLSGTKYKNECCIHHNMLQKYGISNLKGTTNDIKKLLEQNDFIENEDFNLRNVSQVRENRGTVIKNEYYLHPRAFKICLMRSLKTKKYAKYYLLLEECIKYFNDYQIELNKKYIIKLKSKIVKKDTQLIIKDDKID